MRKHPDNRQRAECGPGARPASTEENHGGHKDNKKRRTEREASWRRQVFVLGCKEMDPCALRMFVCSMLYKII